MQILRAADYRTMPWKNGMGSTTEIAVAPPQAALGDFDWRVSMAQVTSDGPFSSFPGIDRTLLVLNGVGIDLSVAAQPTVRIDRRTVHAFAGDQPTSARLVDGPIVDLNIMSRRDVVSHHVQRIKIVQHHDIPVSALTFVFVEAGEICIAAPVPIVLGAMDSIIVDIDTTALAIEAHPSADLVVAQFNVAHDRF